MLTKRQKQILDFIKLYQDKKGYGPSLDEIKKHLRLSSVSTVHYHIEKMEKSGYLKKDNHQARSIELKENPITGKSSKPTKGSFSVPVYGSANAGSATIFAEENIQGYLKVLDNSYFKKVGLFAVRVKGNSMNKAKIKGKNLEDGDYALIDSKYKNPQNGDYVLSIIDNCANLKKFERENKTGMIKLISESTNTDYKPIYISSEDNYMVNGKIIAVLKK